MSIDDQFNDDQFNDDPFGDSEEPQEMGSAPQPKKKGMSTMAKVLIFLGCSAFGIFALCCGGGIWWVSKMQPTQNPGEIAARTKTIVDIEIPATFKPTIAMDVKIPFAFTMKMAVYNTAQQGMLILMSMDLPTGGPQQEAQMRQQMKQQGHGRQLTIKSSETKKFMIRGKEVEFNFAKATEDSTNKPFRQVTSSFNGKIGMTMLIMQIPEDEYKEEEIIKMIESIK